VTSDKLGAELATLDDSARAQLNLSEDTAGVLIVAIDDDGPAAKQGLRPGDVITRVGQTKVERPQQVTDALDALGGKSVLLLVNRQGQERFVGFKVAGV
jgi:serine protease Do